MEWLHQAIDLFLHLDHHLDTTFIPLFGSWLYLVLFLVIFCETGLVVTPFLPGDSLLFAVGAIAARDGSPLNIVAIFGLLAVAAVVGDAVNYWVGYRIGPRIFRSEGSWLFNREHLIRTQHFYEKHGGKTIILARFIPIIRTFAPFVAGVGKMEYRRFGLFNITGGVAWVASFLLAGYCFGGLDYVKRNFQYVILAIIVISVLPIVIEFVQSRRRKVAEKPSHVSPPVAPERTVA